jgi:hypothetical protein
VNSRFINFPKHVNNEEIQDCLILKNGHMTIEKAMAERGTPLEALPFPGAVWVSDHGDNWTTLIDSSRRNWHQLRFSLKYILQQQFVLIGRRRLVSSSFKREFGLLN